MKVYSPSETQLEDQVFETADESRRAKKFGLHTAGSQDLAMIRVSAILAKLRKLNPGFKPHSSKKTK